MPRKRTLQPQSVWDAEAVLSVFAALDVAEQHAYRMWGSLLRRPSSSWHDVDGIPKRALDALDSSFVKFSSKLHAVQRSTDGETMKLLLSLQDGLKIEACVMQYDTRDLDEQGAGGNVRSTLCVSSQVGCKMGCTFCATGTMGLEANLTAGEIVEQLAFAVQFTRIRNVVFMGMGEPLDNYSSVQAALNLMVDNRVFALGHRHVTVSTVGVVDKIMRLAADFPKVSFALSLHAPTQQLRERIVPSARAFKLEKLIAAVRHYQAATGQKVFVEYVMLRQVNDAPEQAHDLGRLLEGLSVTINLIPWNPVISPGMAFEAPGLERVRSESFV